MRKKKLLFVINSLGQGGAEKSLISLLSTIDYERYDIDLQMFHIGGMFFDLLPAEVNVLSELEFLKTNHLPLKQAIFKPKYFTARVRASIGLRLNKRNRRLHDAQCYWKFTHQVYDTLATEYDVAIAWGQGNPTHFVAEKVLAEKKIAFINVNYVAAGHDKTFDFPYYEKYNYIAVVSDDLNKLVTKTFSEMRNKIRTIYDINNASVISEMALESNPMIKDSRVHIIVTVGRLTAQKGYDLATKACEILKKRKLNFKWYIVGEGPERKNIERDIRDYGIAEHMVLVGAKDNPYVYMKNADVYVQTSKFEGYCLTLGEARILNTPVVSTNFDVVYDQLRQEENGLIVEMTGEAVAEGIIRILTDNELREHIIETLKKEKKGNTDEIEKLYQLIEE